MNAMEMALLHVGHAIAVGVEHDMMPMVVIDRREAFLAAGADRAGIGRQVGQIGGRELVRMVERSIDEHIAGGPHDEQQHRADRREPKNPAQHDLAGAHRLGDDRVNRAVLQVGRQAHGAEENRQQHDEIRRRREHEIDIELAGVEAAQLVADRTTA